MLDGLGGQRTADATTRGSTWSEDHGTPHGNEIATAFVDAYRGALLARDHKAIADLYAVPALIEFPGQALAVSDAAQTEDFFAASFGQYDGVSDISATARVIAQTGHNLWVDVAWSYDATPTERYVYQLIHTTTGWKIAVLTLRDDTSLPVPAT